MSEPTGWKPRADFVCRGPKCKREDGSRPTYELPLGSSRCPVCGSKRIEQLITRVAVIGRPSARQPAPDMRLTSSSPFVRSSTLIDEGMSSWGAVRSSAQQAPSQVQSVKSLGGPQGTSKPMLDLQVQAAIREDRAQAAALARRTGKSGLARMPGAVEVQRRMNQQSVIPTLQHYDSRDAGRAS